MNFLVDPLAVLYSSPPHAAVVRVEMGVCRADSESRVDNVVRLHEDENGGRKMEWARQCACDMEHYQRAQKEQYKGRHTDPHASPITPLLAITAVPTLSSRN